nr:MAG TPA: hypothetical protein [Caudoviricetes sp.]
MQNKYKMVSCLEGRENGSLFMLRRCYFCTQ